MFVRRARGFAEQEFGLCDEQIVEGGLSTLAEYADDPETIVRPFDVVPASLASKREGSLDAEAMDITAELLTIRAVKVPDEISLME